MDADTVAQLQRVTDKQGQVVLLEITCASFSGPLRIANDTINHTFNGDEFIGLPFYFKLPDRRQDGAPRAQLAIDNVGRGLTDELENFIPGNTAMARIIVCRKSTPLTVAHEVYIPLTNVSVNQTVATADCGIGFITQQKAVKRRHTPLHSPGLF